MYFELFYARVLPHPTARAGCSFFTVTLYAAAQGIHCCLAIFFLSFIKFQAKTFNNRRTTKADHIFVVAFILISISIWILIPTPIRIFSHILLLLLLLIFMFIFILILISTVKWVSKQRPGTLWDGAVTVRVLQNRSIFGSLDLSILRWLRTQLDPVSRIGRARFVSACQAVNQSGIFPPLASCCCCRSKKGHNRTRWTWSARSREVQ